MPRKPVATHARGSTVTLRYLPLAGDDAELDALGFAEYIAESIHALQITADLIAGRSIRTRYTVARLGKSSPAIIVVTPVVGVADVVVVEAAQVKHVLTLEEIQAGRIPSYLDLPALRRYQRLGQIAKRGGFETSVETGNASVVSGGGLKDRLDLALKRDQFTTGTARGCIRSYHAAGSRRLIRLYPRTGPALTCSFRERDRASVRALIDKNVEVAGKMRYRPNEYFPYFLEIDTISQILPGPTFREMTGFAPAMTGDVAPEDFIRERRNGW
jgi:hypothetical protein